MTTTNSSASPAQSQPASVIARLATLNLASLPLPGQKKPFVKRSDTAATGERPKRDFKRDERPRDGEARAEGPFRKGPRQEGKPFEKRDGPRKPFVPRQPRPEGGERPQRDFKRDDRPREGEAPSQGPKKAAVQQRRSLVREGRPFEKRDGPRKPFVPRENRALR